MYANPPKPDVLDARAFAAQARAAAEFAREVFPNWPS
jgi:hypothetical protein